MKAISAAATLNRNELLVEIAPAACGSERATNRTTFDEFIFRRKIVCTVHASIYNHPCIISTAREAKRKESVQVISIITSSRLFL